MGGGGELWWWRDVVVVMVVVVGDGWWWSWKVVGVMVQAGIFSPRVEISKLGGVFIC